MTKQLAILSGKGGTGKTSATAALAHLALQEMPICAANDIEVVGRLPYDTIFTEAMVQGQAVTSFQPEGEVAAALGTAWSRVQAWLGLERTGG
jgi:MinD superfamily P-loop ATPase